MITKEKTSQEMFNKQSTRFRTWLESDTPQLLGKIEAQPPLIWCKLCSVRIFRDGVLSVLNSDLGTDLTRRRKVGTYFSAFTHFYRFDDFVVICGDESVELVRDDDALKVDPLGVWIDEDHGWQMAYFNYHPCDLSRSPQDLKDEGDQAPNNAFTLDDRLIYVCPDVLDNPKGRILAPYKDRILDGQWIENYDLLPSVLFHELYHTNVVSPTRKSRLRHRIIILLTRYMK